MMLMKGSLSHTQPPSVRYEAHAVKYMTELKYLGLTVRERLNFNYHLRSVKEKLSKSVGAVKRILRVDYELGRKAVRVIYKGLFTPYVLYGAAVWYHIVETSHGRRNILTMQRTALPACLAVCRTVSTDALQVLEQCLGIWKPSK